MPLSELSKKLSKAFCADFDVNALADGYAISTAFLDQSKDRIGFYMHETGDGVQFEDDGEFLARLVACDLPFEVGQRAVLLDAILEQGGAYWDRDTYEIKTRPFPAGEASSRSVAFLSSLIRVRDLELLTRENVKSTFRDDVLQSMKATLSDQVEIIEGGTPSGEYSEFPADFIVNPRAPSSIQGAVYLANSNEKLSEALLLQQEAARNDDNRLAVIAVIEDSNLSGLSRKKFQRAQNRSLTMPIFRGDERAAMQTIGRKLGIRQAA